MKYLLNFLYKNVKIMYLCIILCMSFLNLIQYPADSEAKYRTVGLWIRVGWKRNWIRLEWTRIWIRPVKKNRTPPERVKKDGARNGPRKNPVLSPFFYYYFFFFPDPQFFSSSLSIIIFLFNFVPVTTQRKSKENREFPSFFSSDDIP